MNWEAYDCSGWEYDPPDFGYIMGEGILFGSFAGAFGGLAVGFGVTAGYIGIKTLLNVLDPCFDGFSNDPLKRLRQQN
jgi:hypothetical protein